MTPVELLSDRLLLRAPRLEDVASIVASCQDPDTQQWTTVPAPYGEEDALAFVRDYSAGGWASDERAVFAITGAADGGLLGVIDLRFDGAGGAEVGFQVSPWARGRGVGTEALRMVCRWAFDSLGIARIEWQAVVGNHVSRRLAEKVGFVVEGTCRQRLNHRGVRLDGWIGGLLPGELR